MTCEMGWADGKSLSEFVDELNYMASNVAGITDEALSAGAQIILDEAVKTTAWKDTKGKGKHLRKMIKKNKIKTDKKGQKYILIGSFSRDAFYARMLEFGTTKMDAHPWLRPAYERKIVEAVDEIKKHIVEAMNNGL